MNYLVHLANSDYLKEDSQNQIFYITWIGPAEFDVFEICSGI